MLRHQINSTYTYMQLVFGHDAILNIAHEANWKLIKDRKQDVINKNNANENTSRKPHVYNVRDRVLI